MAEVEVRKVANKAGVVKSNLEANVLRQMLCRGELWTLIRVGLVGLVAAFVLLVISGQLKTMAGELVAIWIVDGYLLGHMMWLQRRYKPVFLVGAAIGLVLGNLMGDETFYVAFSFTAA